MHVKIPEIAVPHFWLANFGKVQDYLRRQLRTGKLHDVGTSSLGYPIHAVEYAKDGCVKLMVVGGTHGHEPGTVATVMNVIHLMETGRDHALRRPQDHLPVGIDLAHEQGGAVSGDVVIVSPASPVAPGSGGPPHRA